MGRVRGVSPEEEVARIIQEAVKGDYKPKSDEEWVTQQKEITREGWRTMREVFRHIWSGGKRR